jgi:hypothetical protein
MSKIDQGRMLSRTGVVPQEWEATLDRCLGDSSWREEFCRVPASADLFEDRLSVRE